VFEWWVIRRQTDKDLEPNFINPVNASPPWLRIETIDCECPTCKKWGQDGRWISEKNDRDFEIIERVEEEK
jgi:hypothetical protein